MLSVGADGQFRRDGSTLGGADARHAVPDHQDALDSNAFAEFGAGLQRGVYQDLVQHGAA